MCSGSEKGSAGVGVARTLRTARDHAVSEAQLGRIEDVLSCTSHEPAARVYVVKILDVHPRMGKVAGRRLLASLGLGPFTRVADVPVESRDAIRAACGGHGG